MVDFKGVHFPKEAILYAVFFHLRYPGSYRDLKEIMEERGVDVDHGTLNRWVVTFGEAGQQLGNTTHAHKPIG
jgi:putative transposase